MIDQWEEIECAICRTREFSTKRHDFAQASYWQCKKCGLVYLSPRPVESQAVAIYDSKDYFSGEGSGYLDYEGDAASYYKTFSRRLNYIKQYKSGGRLLDVGCGTGYFLEVAHRGGFEVNGVDLSSYAVASASAKFPQKVFLGTVEDAALKSLKFDVITMFDLFEHIYRPFDFAQRLNGMLNEGGVVALTTPNYNSLLRKCLGNKTVSFKVPEHVYYYTLETIRIVTKDCFQIVASCPEGQY